jgi:tetratricopeptide (TPR) repeat protein
MKRNSLVLIFCAWCTFLFAQNLAGRADSLILTGEYEKAITLINQSQQAGSPALSYSLDNKKASALTRMGKLDDAQQILNKILEQKPAAKIQAITLTNLGFLYLNRGRNDLALETLKNALDIFQKENENNSLDAAQAMNYLGLVYKGTGRRTITDGVVNP